MTWWQRFRNRATLEDQLDAELRYHFDRLVADYVAAGLRDDQARRRARLELGGIEQVKEVCRDTRGLTLIDGTARDVRYALRTFRRSPGLTATMLAMLALAIGANTAIFSVAKAVILTPLPFRDPSRVVHLFEGHKGDRYQPGRENILMSVRPGKFQDWRDECRSFDGMALVRRTAVVVGGADGPLSVEAFLAGDGYFEILGAPAQIGRPLIAGDYAGEGGRVTVLADRFWRQRYNADPAAVGRDIVVDNAAYRIVGVMPRGFHPTRSTSGGDPQLWLPLRLDPATQYSRTMWGHTVYARLKAGVSLEQAQAELDAVAARVRAAHPDEDGYAVVAPVAGYTYGQHEHLFWQLLIAVGLVLLIASANVANLLIARALERGREFAVRSALGASRRTIMRQVLIEGLMMAGVAGALGSVLSLLLTPPVVALLPAVSRIPRLDQVHIDGGVLVFTVLISVCAGLLFGAAPALRAAAGDLSSALKAGGRGHSMGRSERRLSDVLIVAEVALSLVLLTAGGLMVEAFLKLLHEDPGFRPAHAIAIRLAIPAQVYGRSEADGRGPLRRRLYDRVEKAVAGVPGVDAAAVTTLLPLRQFWDPWGISIEGRPALPPGQSQGWISWSTGIAYHGTIAVQRVTPGYFAALGMPLVQGRLFDDHDRPEAPLVAVINESAARRFFPADDPIGKRVTIDLNITDVPRTTIVGVVRDSRLTGLEREVSPEIFWPMAYAPSVSSWVVVRSRQSMESTADAIRRALASVDPQVAIAETTTMGAVLADSLWQPRFAALLVGALAGLGVLIATFGLYAVISHSVVRQTRELGVRRALGASGHRIATGVIRHGLSVTAVGIVLGSLAAIAVSRLSAQTIPDSVSAWDVTSLSASVGPNISKSPWILPAVAGLLLLLTVLACWMPVRKALAVDPMIALRME